MASPPTEQVKQFESQGKQLEAHRLMQRTKYDMEMMRELGYCSGIENYSRYFDRRKPGARPSAACRRAGRCGGGSAGCR